MEDFIREQNVLRFLTRLETENDPTTRKRLSRLLIEEENKFAITAERLDKTDSHIAKCKRYISLQYTVVEKLKANGHDSQAAERLLRNMMEIHDLYVSYRQVLLDALDRSAL